MKLLVQSIGNHTLLDLNGRQQIAAARPSVVSNTPFIQVNRGLKLEVLEELADEASDETLAASKDADELEAAIAALPRPSKPKPKAPAKSEK